MAPLESSPTSRLQDRTGAGGGRAEWRGGWRAAGTVTPPLLQPPALQLRVPQTPTMGAGRVLTDASSMHHLAKLSLESPLHSQLRILASIRPQGHSHRKYAKPSEKLRKYI